MVAAQPICLPEPGQSYDNVASVVTGWGTTTSDPKDRKLSAILQQANLTTITNSQCKDTKWLKLYSNANKTLAELLKIASKRMVTDNMICAVNPKGGICHGDSGGPLITLDKKGKYVQIGIASWNDAKMQRDTVRNKTIILKQCILENPDVFSRVTAGLQWIKQNIRK